MRKAGRSRGLHRSRRKNSGGLRPTLPLLLLLLLLFAVSAFGGYRYVALHETPEVSEEAEAQGGVWILQNCNVREAPGTEAAVIGGGTEGEVFEYAGRTEATREDARWYSIVFEGRTGWVSEAVAELRLDGENGRKEQ